MNLLLLTTFFSSQGLYSLFLFWLFLLSFSLLTKTNGMKIQELFALSQLCPSHIWTIIIFKFKLMTIAKLNNSRALLLIFDGLLWTTQASIAALFIFWLNCSLYEFMRSWRWLPKRPISMSLNNFGLSYIRDNGSRVISHCKCERLRSSAISVSCRMNLQYLQYFWWIFLRYPQIFHMKW